MNTRNKGFTIVVGGALESKDAAANGTDTTATGDGGTGGDAGGPDKVVALREVKGLLDTGRKDIAKMLDEHKAAADTERKALEDRLASERSNVESLEVKFAELRAQVDEADLRVHAEAVAGVERDVAPRAATTAVT